MTARGRAGSAILALALAPGCEHVLGLGEPTLAPDAGPAPGDCDDGAPTVRRQVVIDTIDVPVDIDEVTAAGFDLDGDASPDNSVFNALTSLAVVEPGFALQPTMDATLASGELLQLLQIELQGGCATTTLYEGEDRDVPANPADNLSGEESFRVVGNPRGRMDGRRDGDDVSAGAGGTAELRLPLFTGAAPIELPLDAARVRLVVTEDGVVEGAIGGAIRVDVVEGVVIPSFAASLQAAIERDCGGMAPSCCTPSTPGDTAVSLFDDDGDCAVSLAEVAGDSLIDALFLPGLDLYAGGVLAPNQDGIPDSVTLGVTFTAVNAFFLTPTP